MASSQFELNLVISVNNDTWILSTIDNNQVLSLQKHLWRTLFGITLLNTPQLLTGDFIAILNDNEHKGGAFRNYASKANIFMNFIFANNLFDLGYIGSNFTYCNG